MKRAFFIIPLLILSLLSLPVFAGQMGGQMSAAPNKPTLRGAQAGSSGYWSVSNVTWQVFNANVEIYDTDTFHDNVTNNSRLTIPAVAHGKKVRVSASFMFPANTTGIRAVAVYLNGTLISVVTYPANPSYGTLAFIVSEVRTVSAGDYFQFYAYQNSGVSLQLVINLIEIQVLDL